MTALDDADRRIIAQARDLAALDGKGIRESTGYDDPAMALAAAMGRAQWLLGMLAWIAERADGADDDAGRLDRIRVVLSRFDWEHDDRQLALEAVERIVEGGQAHWEPSL